MIFSEWLIFPIIGFYGLKLKRRMFKRVNKKQEDLKDELISEKSFNQSLQSYLGMLKHCNGYKIEKGVVALIFGFPLSRE